jgi:hypothetical protein
MTCGFAVDLQGRQIFRKTFPAIASSGVLLDGGIGRPSRLLIARRKTLQVRSLLEQPTCTVRLAAKDVRFSSGKSRVQIPHGAPIIFPQLNWMSSPLRTERHTGSSPVGKANHQRVGESGRPYLPWKQGIGGSNPPALTNRPLTTQIPAPG